MELLPCVKENVERVEHVFESVKDFNFTGTCYDKEALLKMTEEKNKLLFGIRVEDRFGNYGIAGALAGDRAGSIFVVDNLLLNCRILGKKVEYHVLRQLAERLQELELTHVELHYDTNGRNEMAAGFIQELSGEPSEKILAGKGMRLEVQRLLTFAAEKIEAKKEKKLMDHKNQKDPFRFIHDFFENKTEEKQEILKMMEGKPDIATIMEEMRKNNGNLELG